MHHIRKGELSDLSTIMEIETAAHAYPWSEKIMLRYLHKQDSVWVMDEQGTHVAHAVISTVLDEAELLMVSVLPERQGQGLGRALLTRVIEILVERKIVTFFLEVRESNAPAIALYDALGFNETGRRDGYYPHPDGREDALIFSLDLTEDE